MGERCCWSSLHNIYDSWSDAKQKAFDWCWEQYANIMRIETKDNSYLVWLER